MNFLSSGTVYTIQIQETITSKWASPNLNHIKHTTGIMTTTKEILCLGSSYHNNIVSFPQLEIHFQYKREIIHLVDLKTIRKIPMQAPDSQKVKVSVTIFNDIPTPEIKLKKYEISNLKKSDDGYSIEGKIIFNPESMANLMKDLDAKVNVSLINFKGELLQAQTESNKTIIFSSANLTYIYRKKLIIFIPGVLGSKIELRTKEGLKEIYPKVYISAINKIGELAISNTSFMNYMSPFVIPHLIVEYAYKNFMSAPKVGKLECDEEGNPLLEAQICQNSLLELWGLVYDVKKVSIDSWQNKMKKICPHFPTDEEIQPFIFEPWPYDWRLDLENTTQSLFHCIKERQKELLNSDNTDDKICLVGHSTGGIIIKRLCTLDLIDNFVDTAFFINVPFRGAPKALSVFLLGGNPPMNSKFSELVPFIDRRSLVFIAPVLPIVYYLAPTEKFPKRVTSYGLNGDIESQKHGLIDAAIEAGIYYKMLAIDSQSISDDKFVRQSLAIGSEQWHETWERFSRRLHNPIVDKNILEQKFNSEIKENSVLCFQRKYRKNLIGWNSILSKRVKKFHQECDMKIDESKVKLYVFYSIGHPTTSYISIKSDGRLFPISPITKIFNNYPNKEFDQNNLSFEQWFFNKNNCTCEKKYWTFESFYSDGDETVPLASLVGIGTYKAKIFKPIPEYGNPNYETCGPVHTDAPNKSYVWDRVFDVILEENINEYIDNQVDPVNEKCVWKPIDESFKFLENKK